LAFYVSKFNTHSDNVIDPSHSLYLIDGLSEQYDRYMTMGWDGIKGMHKDCCTGEYKLSKKSFYLKATVVILDCSSIMATAISGGCPKMPFYPNSSLLAENNDGHVKYMIVLILCKCLDFE
jgi:hypothetical protein